MKHFKQFKVTAPAMKHREGWKAPKTELKVFYYEHTVGVPWAQMRPLIACAFRHVQREAFRAHKLNFITRCRDNITELYLAKGSRGWHGRNTGIRSRVFVGNLFTAPRRSTYPKFKDMPEHWEADWREAAVGLTAHELWHRWQRGHGRKAEYVCELVEWDAVDTYRRECGYTFTPPPEVHHEPPEMRACTSEMEHCADCRRPTQYWLADNHTPLCQDCCAKRNKGYTGIVYFEKAVADAPA